MSYRNGKRPVWPEGERESYPEQGKVYPDSCPPYELPIGDPPPPPNRNLGECPPGVSREEYARFCVLAQRIGMEVADFAWNPYLFPNSWSQDFDKVGQNTVTVISPARFRVALFQVPRGYVGIWDAIGVEIPPALQNDTFVHPFIAGSTVKDFDTQAFAGAGAVAPTELPGSRYVVGTLNEPRKIFHPVQSEMTFGIEVEVRAAGAPLLPAVFRGVVRGRYWPTTKATRYWNYVKQD